MADPLTNDDIRRITDNVNAVNAWAEGDDAFTATMANGRQVPSPSKLIADARLYKAPLAYNAGTTYTDATQPVDEAGVIFIPNPSDLPIGPEAFDSNHWLTMQGFIEGTTLNQGGANIDMGGGDIIDAGLFDSRSIRIDETGATDTFFRISHDGVDQFSAAYDASQDKMRFALSGIIGDLELFTVDGGTQISVWNDTIDASAGGIFLGGNVAANLLDDYEEGTFTPIIADATVGGNVATLGGTVIGNYTKTGNKVSIEVRADDIDTTGMTPGNTLYLRGLPFTSGTSASAGVCTLSGFTFATGYISPNIDSSDSWMFFRNTRTGTSDLALTVAAIDSSSSDIVALSITYFV